MIEVLQPAETASFRDEGYVAVARPVIPLDGLAEVAHIFDDLQSRIHELPPENVHDLGVPTTAATTIPEVIFTTQLEPGLFDTSVYETCRLAASELLGGPATLTFDHLIVKPAHSEATTQWHQDQSYDLEADPGSANFWIPLTAVSAETSCMRFIPRSHLSPQLLEHRKSGVDALEAIGVDDSARVECPLPLGGFTVHTQRTLHSSGPNYGDTPRRAWIIKFILDRPPDTGLRSRARGWARRLRSG